jgi:AI-2 transport protein TqsA
MSANPEGAFRTLVICASIIILIAGLKSAASLILPFLLAVIIALISMPLLDWLRMKRVPASLAAVLTVLADIIILASLGLLVSGSIQGFTEAAPRYQVRLEQLANAVLAKLHDWGIGITAQEFGDLINAGVALDLMTSTLRGAANVVSKFFLVFLTIIFILFEVVDLRAKLEIAFGKEIGIQRMESVRRQILRYLGIKTLVSMLTGILVGSALRIMGIDFAILWGLLAFLMNYIPNLGSILAAIPPILLALIQYGPGRALAVGIVFLVVNLTVGSFLEPRWLGERLGMSTLVVFLSLVFWGWVWGPVGMLLSVPLTMIVKIMLENSSQLQWIAVMMGPGPRVQK